MVSVDLNALEIGAVLLLEGKSRDSAWNRIVCRSDCVRSLADEELQTSEELHVLFGSECSKGERPAPRCVILVRESENGRDVRSLGGGVRNERHLVATKTPKRVFTTRDVERNWSWSLIPGRDCSAQCLDDWEERQFRYDDHDCKVRVHEVLEARKTVSPAVRVQARSLVVGGRLGSRDVGYPIPKAGLMEERRGPGRAREDATRRVAISSKEQHG